MEVERDLIPVLADYFVRKYCEELACPPKKIDPPVAESLKKHPWLTLGQLEATMKRAVVIAPSAVLISRIDLPRGEVPTVPYDDSSLEEVIRRKLGAFFSKWEGYEISDLREEVLRRVEKPLIELVLKKTGGNQLRAARMLGINRNTLFKKIKEMGLSPKT
ncbi:MAG: hypothetical protein HYY44_01905 [Deltaproteobacteria bacterium]|nr:hypothetical protein [Deltaproteobacteria bacterium]MBI4373666.1 hypothetical protein [Deltaproteobacteria bacterium]